MTEFSKIPTEPHYAIIESETIRIPGDERSRTHPGHGYPAEDREIITYRAFSLDQRKEWEHAVSELANRPFAKFRAMHVEPAAVTTKITVSVKVG